LLAGIEVKVMEKPSFRRRKQAPVKSQSFRDETKRRRESYRIHCVGMDMTWSVESLALPHLIRISLTAGCGRVSVSRRKPPRIGHPIPPPTFPSLTKSPSLLDILKFDHDQICGTAELEVVEVIAFSIRLLGSSK